LQNLFAHIVKKFTIDLFLKIHQEKSHEIATQFNAPLNGAHFPASYLRDVVYVVRYGWRTSNGTLHPNGNLEAHREFKAHGQQNRTSRS
jgi:hypothetical protein